jgi:hypothetical protein
VVVLPASMWAEIPMLRYRWMGVARAMRGSLKINTLFRRYTVHARHLECNAA